MNGALLIRKEPGVSSFGVVDALKTQLIKIKGIKPKDLPKLGHGGTLDPFATGLLMVCIGRGVKLARYFLGSRKEYEGLMKFGETTVPGDPTSPISESTNVLPESIEPMQDLARRLTLQPYLQIPPMHSAKKVNGKPLYELAREGIEIERDPKLCHLFKFEILSFEKPYARFRVRCSSGTYIRTLAQDFGKLLGSLALLETLDRTGSGAFSVANAWSLGQMREATEANTPWNELPNFIPFDRMLESYSRADASDEEAQAIYQGRQNALFSILKRATHCEEAEDIVTVYHRDQLIAIARRENNIWGLERVFVRS